MTGRPRRKLKPAAIERRPGRWPPPPGETCGTCGPIKKVAATAVAMVATSIQ